jgi:hypothetical protein
MIILKIGQFETFFKKLKKSKILIHGVHQIGPKDAGSQKFFFCA